ncbi:putative ribonuclease H-like domain-containing protein [Tanacetum coccineum]
MSNTRRNNGSGVSRPKINDKTHFELKGKFLMELRENTFSGSEHEDANEHIKKVLEIVDLFHMPEVTQDQIMLRAFPMSLTGAASCWLRNEPSGSSTNWETLKTKFLNKSDANYAKDYTTQRTVYSRKKGKLLKRLTTYSLEHLINLEDSIEQQGQDSTNATMEILFLQERGIRGLPGSTEPNPRDHVKSISTAKADSSVIHHIGSGPYAKKAREVKILLTYDHTLPQKEKDPGSFTLPCFIHNICFDKALVDLGASVSVMPFSTYSNLGLDDLSHTRLTIELADRTIKHPKGIAENVKVRIGKFIFPIDFVILDIPKDDDIL